MAESMKDYENELEASFKKIEEGDILTGTVISVDEKEVTVDLKYYAEGIIPAEDYSREPGFSLKDEVHPGDEVSATVIRTDDGQGNILLSRVEAADVLAWDKLQELKESGEILDVVVKGVVNGGVIAYVEGVRGFIPASKLALSYVEDTNEYLNKPIQVRVFDVEKDNKRLILSAREILREKAEEERRAARRIKVSDEDYQVLLRIVQAEAGVCDEKGKILVADVIINRVLSGKFPGSVKGVVYQGSQFQPVSNGRINSVKVTAETIRCVDRALDGEDYSNGALYFMNRKASGRKAGWFDSRLTYLFAHGGHEFFK